MNFYHLISFRFQTLQKSLQSVQPTMASIQTIAQQLTDQTDQPTQWQGVVATVASLQTRLAEVTHDTDETTAKLTDALEPWKQYHKATEAVSDWLEQGVDTLQPPLTLTSMPAVMHQLQDHKVSQR